MAGDDTHALFAPASSSYEFVASRIVPCCLVPRFHLMRSESVSFAPRPVCESPGVLIQLGLGSP